MFKKLNFRNKLLAVIVPINVIFISIMVVTIYQYSKDDILKQQDDNIVKILDQTLVKLDSWIENRERDLLVLKDNDQLISAFNNNDNSRAQEILRNFFSNSTFYENIFIADSKGFIFLDTVEGKSKGINLSESIKYSENFNSAKVNKDHIGKPIKSAATGHPVITVTTPIFEKNSFKGLIGATVSLNKFYDLFLSKIKIGDTGYFYVMDKEGLVLGYPKKEQVLKLSLASYSFGRDMVRDKNGKVLYDWHGVDKFAHFKTLKKLDWIVAASGTVNEFLASSNKIKNITAICGVFLILIVSVATFFVTNQIFQGVKQIIINLRSGSTQITAASSELSSASQELSAGANEQSSSIEETSSSLEEINGMIQNNVENTETTVKLSNKVKDSSTECNTSMSKLQKSMTEILESNEKIEQLVKVISDIGEKTKIMDEIVFQTKLLSFNASVEAERAGEHGRGFAVVAQEVGNLAQMSGQSAQEIATIVNESIKNAKLITVENKEKVEQSGVLVQETAKNLSEIMEVTEHLVEGGTQVLSASKNQAEGIKQINCAVEQLNKATQENAATSEETASTSEELSSQTHMLDQIVDQLNGLIMGAEVVSENSVAPLVEKQPLKKVVNMKDYKQPAETNHIQVSEGVSSQPQRVVNGDGWERL